MATKHIEVRAGDDAGSIAVAETRDTMKEAKRRARYLKSDEYARLHDMSHAFRFVAIFVDGENVFEA